MQKREASRRLCFASSALSTAPSGFFLAALGQDTPLDLYYLRSKEFGVVVISITDMDLRAETLLPLSSSRSFPYPSPPLSPKSPPFYCVVAGSRAEIETLLVFFKHVLPLIEFTFDSCRVSLSFVFAHPDLFLPFGWSFCQVRFLSVLGLGSQEPTSISKCNSFFVFFLLFFV